MLYWLIETEEQLQKLFERKYDKVFIELIYFNDNFHPVLNQLCALYFRPLNEKKGFMICLDHNDSLSIEENKVFELLKNINQIYVRDKKSFLKFYQLQNLIDISFNNETEINKDLILYNQFYQKWGDKKDINKLIPIVKHYEYCELIWEQAKQFCNTIQNEYQNKLSIIFSAIENNGIKINKEIFDEYFKPINPIFNTQEDTIYTQYNLYNTTGRPSNNFNGINFAALNKENGCRKAFIPKNDLFIEFDLTAYHPTLVAKLINFDFNKETPYEYFIREANIPVGKAKVEFIRQMYGGVFEKYENIEFFRKMKGYSNQIFEEFDKTGIYTCNITNKKFYKNKLEEMTPGKLLSYLIQQLETYYNVEIMWEMMKLLCGKETQLILYCYDSFLFDFKKGEEETLQKIEEIFKKNNLKYKKKEGINYDFKQ